jgi:pantetheine-phosphate adenylyltransferase
MSVAIYPGSFDPITNGHLSIIKSGLTAFDRLVVAVLANPKKTALFTVEERIQMIRQSIDEGSDGGGDRVEVDNFEGLLVDYCRQKGARIILRGLRAVADFEYELQMANMNRHLEPGIETMFVMANDAYFYVSSNLVKEAATLGGGVSRLVPPCVGPKLYAKLGR